MKGLVKTFMRKKESKRIKFFKYFRNMANFMYNCFINKSIKKQTDYKKVIKVQQITKLKFKEFILFYLQLCKS